MFYLGIVLAIIGAIMLIVGVFFSLYDEGCILIYSLSVIPIILSLYFLTQRDANINDVVDGKAQQVLYTTYVVNENGDTISCEKTYKIEWKDELKN